LIASQRSPGATFSVSHLKGKVQMYNGAAEIILDRADQPKTLD